jgi:O-antigen/teichoic acid export membrane protein
VAVARVSVPAFARLQHDRPKLQAVHGRSNLVLLAVTLPSCLLLAVFADP